MKTCTVACSTTGPSLSEFLGLQFGESPGCPAACARLAPRLLWCFPHLRPIQPQPTGQQALSLVLHAITTTSSVKMVHRIEFHLIIIKIALCTARMRLHHWQVTCDIPIAWLRSTTSKYAEFIHIHQTLLSATCNSRRERALSNFSQANKRLLHKPFRALVKVIKSERRRWIWLQLWEVFVVCFCACEFNLSVHIAWQGRLSLGNKQEDSFHLKSCWNNEQDASKLKLVLETYIVLHKPSEAHGWALYFVNYLKSPQWWKLQTYSFKSANMVCYLHCVESCRYLPIGYLWYSYHQLEAFCALTILSLAKCGTMGIGTGASSQSSFRAAMEVRTLHERSWYLHWITGNARHRVIVTALMYTTIPWSEGSLNWPPLSRDEGWIVRDLSI